MRSRFVPPVAAIAAVSIAASALFAGSAGDLRSLFPFSAPIRVSGTGLARLTLPPEVLKVCRPDLSDVRILRTDGTEAPYVIVESPPAASPAAEVVTFRPGIVAVDRRVLRPADRPAVYRESYLLSVPAMPRAAAWRLRFSLTGAEVVCRVQVSAVEKGGQRRTLVSAASIFRLSRLDAERLEITLPPVQAPHLEVLLEGENGGYVEPGIQLDAVPAPPAPPPLQVPLAVEAVHSGEGRTVVVVRRPLGLVPSRLRIGTTTGSFLRKVTVTDETPDGERTVGEGRVYRLQGIAPVESLDVPVASLTGDRFRLEIVNGDSPPLEKITCVALVPAPVLVFSVPTTGGELALYFGGGRTFRPRYDLEALLGEGGPVGSRVADARPARLGAISKNPAFDPAPALGFLMHPGSKVEIREFTHRRVLRVRPSAEGLARLDLRPEDLAACRRDLGDLRIVDADGRQWPYLLSGQDTFTTLGVGFRRVDSRTGESRYRIELPAAPLEVSGISVDSDAPFFDRRYRVLGTPQGGKRRLLTEGRLRRSPGQRNAIDLPFPRVLLEDLSLIIENGGDAPLRLSKLTVKVPRPAVYLPAPAGTYTLYLGNPRAEAPRFEIAAARSMVLGVPAGPIEAGPLERNPAYNPGRRLVGSWGAQEVLLWVLLFLAVVVLAGLALRHARQEGAS